MASENGDDLRSPRSRRQGRWPYPYQPILIGEGTWAPIRPADRELWRMGVIECSDSDDLTCPQPILDYGSVSLIDI